MGKRSNLLIILGLTAFVLGTSVVLLVLRGEDDEAGAGTVTPGSVLVARQDLVAGTSGADVVAGNLVEVRTVPGEDRQADALTTTAELGGRVLAADVRAGEQLRASALRPAALRSGAVDIPEGKQGVAVQLPFVPGVAGYVAAGDHVNLYANIKAAGPMTKLVLPNVEVLDVSTEIAPRRAGTSQGERATGSQITYLLALDAVDAERVIFLAENETLYLTLVPKGQAASAAPGRNYDNILR